MGTPEIVVESLTALAREHEIAGLFCQPDKPVGRKQVLTTPPAKTAAAKLGIPVFQPASLKGDDVCDLILRLSPELIVVMAYGKILPKRILDAPKFGCVNAHASLLPKYRGAAPVQYALMNGESKTGVSIQLMDEGVDTGDIICSREIAIHETDDAESVFKKIAALSAGLLPEAVRRIGGRNVVPVKQNEEEATYAPRIEKNMGLFSFSDDSRAIHNLIRGLCVWPVAFFRTGDKVVKVFKSEYLPDNGAPGEVLSLKPFTVAAEKGALALLEVMPAGGRRMDGTAFASGLRLKKGSIL